jgi:hypothetical protein
MNQAKVHWKPPKAALKYITATLQREELNTIAYCRMSKIETIALVTQEFEEHKAAMVARTVKDPHWEIQRTEEAHPHRKIPKRKRMPRTGSRQRSYLQGSVRSVKSNPMSTDSPRRMSSASSQLSQRSSVRNKVK